MSVTSRALWRIRLGRDLPHYLFSLLALAGVAASVRFVLDPLHPNLSPAPARRGPVADVAAEGLASLFARSYLTWEAADPQAYQRAMARFGGLADGAGLRLPAEGAQRVQWTQVVQEREPLEGEHVYTVAVETDPAGLLYLSVEVIRGSDGRLALAGYPAFVGAPAIAQALLSTRGSREVSEPALQTVITRALRNYLTASPSDLQADLTAGARVSPPSFQLALISVQQLRWQPGGGAVLAVVQADDARGTQYTLGYEVDVIRQAGRWEISAIQMDPNT